MKDYYYILGIKKEASFDEVKKAYRKLSMKFHPDKNEGDEFFANRFKEIQEAYETLSDIQKRKLYDGKTTTTSHNNNAKNGFNFNPEVEYFRADQNSFEFDEEITFSWKTINADRVTIKPFGIVQPIGQKTYRIKDFKNATLNFELVAENTNISRQVKYSLKLNNKTFQELYSYFKKLIETEHSNNHNSETKDERQKSSIKKTMQKFKTDKGELNVELLFENANPCLNNKVFQNNIPAKNGKYKLGFMNYIVIENGIVVDMTIF